MLRYIGIGIFSVCISLIGFHMSFKADKEMRTRRELIELISSIQSGIRYGALSLTEICRNFPACELKKCGFYDELIKSSHPDLKNALMKSHAIISNEAAELFCSFADNCGKSTFSEEEIKNCDKYISLFEQLDKKLSEKENTKKLLYSKLGILAGILSCILLL